MEKQLYTRTEVKTLIHRAIAQVNESRSTDWDKIKSRHQTFEKQLAKTNPRLAKAHGMMARVSLNKDRDMYNSARQTLRKASMDV